MSKKSSIDLLTFEALKALDSTQLPILQTSIRSLIDEIFNSPPSQSLQISDNFKSATAETMELLNLVQQWANTLAKHPSHEMDHKSEVNFQNLEHDTKNKQLITEIDLTLDGAMSDEEARMLLESMDAPIVSVEEKQATTDHATTQTAEISDEIARKLLEEMDTPLEGVSKNQEPHELVMDSPLDTNSNKIDPATVTVFANTVEDNSSSELDITGINEIPEWENNDFASDPEMMSDFTQNTGEIMQTLDDTVLKLEQNPTDKATIEEIFRAAHTLKGAAGMFGFKSIERVMHRMENLFDLIRRGKLVPNSSTIDVVFQGLDVLKKLLAAVLAGKPSGIKTAPTVKLLELAAEGKAPRGRAKSNAQTSEPNAILLKTKDLIGSNEGHSPTQSKASAPEHPLSTTNTTDANSASKKKPEASSTIRVDIERLDALVNLVGELVIDRTRFVNIEESLRTNAPQLKLASNMTETLQQFGRHMNDIQEIIMKVRMVPVGSVFNKYPRIVRDLARQLDKQIDLVLIGEETELDKTLVEQIADPLVHLIRNACDHGVEMPNERIAKGKKPNGSVTLSAKQEGNHILIQITDDGKGMDVNRIKSKAIEKGLITPDQSLSNKDIFNLIFEPGFSTAEKVTTVSGRGVGMDVVKKQISKLKGVVDIDSAPEKGSKITIQLPLTLAIMQSLLVNVGEEIFAIPLNNVIESIRLKPSEIQRVGEKPVVKIRDLVLPLYYLEESLQLTTKDDNFWFQNVDSDERKLQAKGRFQKRQERIFIVVVGTGDRKFGIVVDALLNQQEVVIKPMGPLMKGIPCISGGAVLGNGEVVLVIDIPELENRSRKRQPTTANNIAS